MVGIEVVDHLIISEDDYFSFAEDGLLDEIKLSDEYRLLDRAKYEQLKSDLKQAGKVEAIFQEKIIITKNLDELGVDKEIIIKATGLDPQLV
jgi:DNA repair protein RadC